MNTHRRAWMLRAGVVAALVAGTLTFAASPAQADDPDVQITNLSNGNLGPGQRATLQFAVRNNNDSPTPFAVRVELSEGLRCEGDCNIPTRLIPQEPQNVVTFNANVIAADLGPGQSRQATVRVLAQSVVDGNDADSDERTITVQGPQQAPTAKRVSGQVVDAATGEPIADAAIAMQDSQGNQFSAETNDNGRFTFNGDADNPIVPGRIDVAVGKTGFQDVEKEYNVKAGQSLTNIKISLTSTATPTASPTADATAAPSAEASQNPVALDPAAGEDGGGLLSTIFIIMGGLLVAMGVGAIVLLVVRRRQEKEDEAAEGMPATVGGPRGAVPPSRGAYRGAGDDATRVVSGSPMGADPTMARPGLADAPTMLHAPVRDEYADPYGVPPGVTPAGPGTQGYAGPATQAWSGGYGDATQVGGYPGAPGAPAPGAAGSPAGFGPGGAYGSPAAPRPGFGGPGGEPYGGPPPRSGYGSPGYEDAPGRAPADGFGGREFAGPGPERYDEPTGRFNGAGPGGGPGGGYGTGGRYDDAPPSDYRPPRGDYEGGYGRPTSGGPNGSYGVPPSSGAGYGGAPAGPPPAYDQGYDQRERGSYDPPAYGGPGGGYEGQTGYDQRGGAYGGPSGGYPDQQRGYEPGAGGYEAPEQRGGYDARGGYEQGGYYGDQAPPPSRHSAPQPPPARGERRSLDWLDD